MLQYRILRSRKSPYIAAGSPTRCFLPSCQKPFEGSCFQGEDDRYYCAETCAKIGEKGKSAKVVKIREAS